MKNLFTFLCLVCFLLSIPAQEALKISSKTSKVYKKPKLVFDYADKYLNNVDTIPGFDTKPEKLKITGTVYQSDGKTPAKDVILYVYQPDEHGNYKMKRDENRNRYVYNRGWVKTDANGHYTLYTFIPGKFMSKELKQIQRVIKEPGKPEYDIKPFFFNNDPLLPNLTLACRAKAVSSMLRLEEKDGMFVAVKDIKLNKDLRLIQ